MRLRSDSAGLLLILFLAAVTACTTSPRSPEAAHRAAPAAATVASAPIGYSVEGRPIGVDVLGKGRDCVLVIASLHGDEAAGTPLVERLRERLTRRPGTLAGRTVVLVPVANPDGLARGRRTNAHGVDLNRDFPSANGHRRASFAPAQPETRAIMMLIEQYRPTRIVSLHQPLACIDYDGPAEPLARAMADDCDLRVRKLGARPGSLGSYAGVDRGIPVVTIELPRSASHRSDAALWERYGRMLLRAVKG